MSFTKCIILIWTIFALDFDHASGTGGADRRNEPFGYHFLFNQNAYNFMAIDSNDTQGLVDVMDYLDNDNDLIFFVTGVTNMIPRRTTDAHFRSAKEWFMASEVNLCFIDYPYRNDAPSGPVEYLRTTMSSGRMDFVAEKVCTFLIDLLDKLSDGNYTTYRTLLKRVKILGFSLGAHIGAYICREFFARTEMKIEYLFGLDSAGIPGFHNYIRSGDATYVQCIRTTKMYGMLRMTCDSNISCNFPKFSFRKLKDYHYRAFYLSILIATKKYGFVANDHKGVVVDLKSNIELDCRLAGFVREAECMLGIYMDTRRRGYGNFSITLPNEIFDQFETRQLRNTSSSLSLR